MVLPDTECYSKILRMRCATPYEEDTTYCIKSKHSDMRKLKEIALCKWKQPDTVVYACALLLPVKSAVKCRPTSLGNSNAHDTSLRVRDGMDIPLHNRWFTPQWSSHRSRMPKKRVKYITARKWKNASTFMASGWKTLNRHVPGFQNLGEVLPSPRRKTILFMWLIQTFRICNCIVPTMNVLIAATVATYP